VRIAVWHNLPSGGGKRALFEHVRGLLGRGHQVEVWCPPTADRAYLPLADLVPEHVVPLEGLTELPPLAAGSDRFSLEPYRQVRGFIEAFHSHCRACADQINHGGFDLVFANSCRLTGSPPLAAYVRAPSVLYLQEPRRWLYEVLPPLRQMPWVEVKLWGRYWWTPTRLRHFAAETARVQCLRILAREEQDSLLAFDQVLVNSHFSRENLLRTFGCDARLCYLGIDTEQFRPTQSRRKDFIVGLGAVAPHKNVALAVRAVAALPEPRPPLVWIGNTSVPAYAAEMRALADRLGVDLRISEMLADAELVETLGEAAAMLYTSRLEPFGLAPLEANACGTPVVAVAEGGVRESITDGVNGLLCDADPEQLAAALQRLLSDPALARQMGENARKRVVNQWALESAVDRLDERLMAAAAARSPAAALS
jgi:glycosyltransferase involved in cell wall biosynthesis